MQQFADYWLEAELARGGMGVVYRARHLPSGRACALKVVLSGDRASPAQVHRFKREALAQASLNHPHILRIFDGGEVEGTLYFSMELAEGGDLSVAEDWALPRKVEALAKLARALGYAHEQGYVHRDLKPANVLLTPDGEPKLTDFGLTKRLDSTTLLTQEGALMGTPYYMSPEQAQGLGNKVGPESDVFSLGVLLYHLVTGELPFVGETTVQLLSQIVSGDQDPLLNHGVRDPRLELILCKALEKDPEERYPDGTAVAEDLERWLRGEDPAASRASSFSRIAKKAVEHKTAASVIVLMVLGSLLAVGAIGGAVAYAFSRAEAEAEAARWRVDARAQARALEEVAAGSPDRLPALIAAREAALELLAQEPDAGSDADPAEREALEAALTLAWLRELDHALALGTVAARDHAAASLEAASAALPADAVQEVTLRVRAAGGHPAEGWSTVHLLWSADRPPSPDRLQEALADPALAAPARRAQGARLARAGKHAEAAATWAPLFEATDPDALRALGRVAWSVGAEPTALRAWERALEADPGCGPAALALASCAPRVGAASEAKLALTRAADAADVDLARALLASARDPEALTPAALPAEAAASALIAADLQAGGAASPYADVPGLSGRAAHARWLAEHGAPGPARDALQGLELLRGGARAGAEPQPLLVRRALRDLAAALLALDEREAAAATLEAALRGDPRDLEAHALRLRLDPGLPAVQEACVAAARAELATLDDALGRGVFMTRAARAAAIQRESLPPPVNAGAFLSRGTLGRPALAALLADLERADPPALAAAWVPLPPRVDAEARRAAQEHVATLLQEPDERVRHRILGEAVAMDPYDVSLRFRYARAGRRLQHSLPCYRDHVEGLAVAPYSALMLLVGFRENWGLGATGGLEPDQDTRAFLAEEPDDPARQVIRVFCQYHAVLYPDAQDPAWGSATPQEVLRGVDAVLGRDARYYGLLFLRAHLRELGAAPQDADRDLELAFTLAGDQPSGPYPLEQPAWGELYRAWILASQRPSQAQETLRALGTFPVERETAAGRLSKFLLEDPHMGTLRDDPILKRLLDNLERR